MTTISGTANSCFGPCEDKIRIGCSVDRSLRFSSYEYTIGNGLTKFPMIECNFYLATTMRLRECRTRSGTAIARARQEVESNFCNSPFLAKLLNIKLTPQRETARAAFLHPCLLSTSVSRVLPAPLRRPTLTAISR